MTTSYRYLRRADGKTLEQIISLYREQGWWTRADRPAMVRRILRESHCFLAAFDGGRLVGMARAVNAYSKEAYIHDVAVLKACRGRDIGSQLVSRLVRRLRRDGILWIGLIASSNSAPFYRRLGFRSYPSATAMMLGSPNV